MPQTPAAIVDFWFGQDIDDAKTASQQAALWWSKNAAVDADIKQRFESSMLAAAAGSLHAWTETAVGRLALILLTDQMPRNSYRDTPQAFAFDALARSWCKAGLEQRVDLQLCPIQRVFFYLPLEHSESLQDQDLSVQLFSALANEVATDLQPTFAWYLQFAQRHRTIIQRFGRFPHRNEILQRQSTQEEKKFLLEPGSGF